MGATENAVIPLPEPWRARLRSATRGRQRWQLKALHRRPNLAGTLEKALLQNPGIVRVRANPRSARILILSSPETSGPRIRALLEDCLRDFMHRKVPEGTSKGEPSALTRVLKASVPGRKSLVLPPILSAVGQILHILQGLCFVAIVNSARDKGTDAASGKGTGGARLLVLAGGCLLLSGAEHWVQYLSQREWRRLGNAARHNLRAKLFTRIQRQDLQFFDTYGTGRLIHLVKEDTEQIGTFIERVGAESINKSVIIAVSGIALLKASPRLTLIASLCLPFLLLPPRLFGAKTGRRYAQLGESSALFSQALENSLYGMADVKSFTAERREARRVYDVDTRLSEDSLQAMSATAFQTHLAQAIFASSFTVTAAYGASLVAEGKSPPEKFRQALYWFPQLMRAVTEVDQVTRLYYRAASAAQRLVKVLDTRPRIRSGRVHQPAAHVRGEVVFENVSFGYDPSAPVLHDVSFRLPAGQTLAIVGRTGSGKSTLLRLLLRFHDVDSGRILLDGTDIRELNLRDLRSAISLVSQEVYLFEGTIRNNVLYGRPSASMDEVSDSLRSAGAPEMLETLDTEVGERGRRLSGGERQRVALARSFLKEAPIFALDEATSQLDYETERAVQLSVRRKAAGHSVFVISHRLSTIRYADNIAVLQEGRIQESGNHKELLARRGIYDSLWKLQSGKAS